MWGSTFRIPQIRVAGFDQDQINVLNSLFNFLGRSSTINDSDNKTYFELFSHLNNGWTISIVRIPKETLGKVDGTKSKVGGETVRIPNPNGQGGTLLITLPDVDVTDSLSGSYGRTVLLGAFAHELLHVAISHRVKLGKIPADLVPTVGALIPERPSLLATETLNNSATYGSVRKLLEDGRTALEISRPPAAPSWLGASIGQA